MTGVGKVTVDLVTDCGAIGDGLPAHDVTSAFSAAFSVYSTSSATALEITVPAGIYFMGSGVAFSMPNLTVVGAGFGATTFRPSSSLDGSSTPMFTIANSNQTIRGIEIANARSEGLGPL
jgi:hypothetical protein